MSEYIYFNSRDELLRLEVPSIVYLEADGNYTKIVLANGFESMVCMNRGKMEKFLSDRLAEKAKRFARIGKRHIVNLKYLLQISPLHQRLVLSDQKSFKYELEISKDALKKLKDIIVQPKIKTKD